MKPHEILSKVKKTGSILRSKLPRRAPIQNNRIPATPRAVSSNQIREVSKDLFARAHHAFKRLIVKLRAYDTTKLSRIVLLVILGIYIIGGIVLSVFAYSTNPDQSKKDTIKITKRDIWVKKISSIYPLPAASVNGSYVSLSEFYRQIGYLKTFNSQVPDSLSKEITDETSLRRRVLDNIIETKIIRQEAKKNKIKVTPTDVDAAYKSAADANGGASQIEKVLQNLYAMTPKEFKALIEDQLYREKIQEKVLTQVRLKHILVTDQPKADAALARIQKGETFEAVAQSASEDSNSKEKGGDIGWLGRDDLRDKIDANFESVVVGLKKGQVSGIIKTKYGYHIVKLEDRKGTIDKSFTNWLKEVKKKSKITRLIKS